MKIYVRGLPVSVTEDALKSLFSEHGEVRAANLVKDRSTGQSHGFGFVEMPGHDEANKAIAEMMGKEIEGHTLTVEPAKKRPTGNGRPQGGREGRGGMGGNRDRDRDRDGGRGRS